MKVIRDIQQNADITKLVILKIVIAKTTHRRINESQEEKEEETP